ncbi:putative disease resistance protein [Iris pallida]|uniref:Disease resistance protein n=1 Tax=Iris pallida TaxID=29817 RepID=A0AAX6H9X3_IRIPA|nr:putative disease resistance protein [Iris pallida]
MEIVSSFIQPFMYCIGTPVIRQFGYLKVKETVDKLINLAGHVDAKKKDIQNEIEAASRDGRQCTNEVVWWIEKVEGLGGKVTKVQSDYDQRGRCSPNCWSSYKIGRRASKLLTKMVHLDKERAGLDVLVTNIPPASVQQMSNVVVGDMITLNKEKVCRYLEEETDGVVGIWGMGGVGKTTLLEAINDNFLNDIGNSVTNKLFDHVMFIVVSKEHQPENIQKTIVKKLRLRWSEDFVSQAEIIHEYLKEKNFLLLLDDIWRVVQLKDIGIPYPRGGGSGRRFRRKVVFTTRSMEVCKGMNCRGRIIKVECLKEDEAWNLFVENVGEDMIDLPGIRSRAEGVARECGGLPLALVVIGRAMATKGSQEEWDYALTQLRKSQPNNIPGMEEDYSMFPRLKFSYDCLRSDKMRECFLCCSLWPEDFIIAKMDLIECWMGHGLIDNFEDINEAYDEGCSLIGSLIAASLLEPVQEMDSAIKVHDVIRDLALWIACDNRDKWLVKAGVGLKEVPSEMLAKWGAAERVSLMKNEISELPPHFPPCPNLSTLLLQENCRLTAIPGSLFACMPNLTYLDLSSITNLREIPKEICCSVQLRCLNLSYTNISSLPEELGQLINLKYLLLRHTDELRGEVKGIIGRLLKLEYLDLYPCGFAETDELLRLPLLKALGTKITSEHALRQLSRVPLLYLNIEDMGDSTTTSIHLHHLLLGSCTKLSLRELKLYRCCSMRELVVDVDVRLPRLESLMLDGLANLTEIVWRRSVVPPSECFGRLRDLRIWNCHGLKDITWVLHLPCLEELELLHCEEMEQVVAIGEEEREKVTEPTFPRLRQLRLYYLPKLAMICDNNHAAAVNFPSLKWLQVLACKELKRLPFHPQLLNNCSRLKTILGEREWWEGIEWEDQSGQSSLLQPYFKAMGDL